LIITTRESILILVVAARVLCYWWSTKFCA